MNKLKVAVLALASLAGLSRGRIVDNLANEAAATSRSAQHWKRKTALAIGRPDLANADDESLEAAHDAHMQAANELEDAPPGPVEISADNEEKGKEDGLANEELVKTRKKLAETLVGGAIAAGRILPAKKDHWLEQFANDFDAAETALANEKAGVIKTRPVTGNLGDQSQQHIANETARREKVDELVNEEMGKNGGDYDKAFAKVQRHHKELFGAMKDPAAKK
jgi:hypothetical protein